MKNQIGISILSSVLGGGLVLFGLNVFNSKTTVESVSDSDRPSNFISTVALEKETISVELPDLTYSASKTVETVVYIQTNFVKEEITYDPYLKLFYGKDAYRKRERHGQASGSGVIISDDGYIVTNNHVVQNAKSISVTINKHTYVGKLVGSDPSTDIAVIKIDAKGLNYSEFGDSDELKLGEWVLAVGNPLNLQSTVTAGIISAKNRNIDLLTSSYNPSENVFPIESFIQTDAAVNSGNSGGALVNKQGELIGVNTAIASSTGSYSGYSFAVPSNIVKKVTFDLIKHGTVKRVMLGVNIIENDSELQKEYNLSTNEGIVISGIVAGGTASKNELKVKDIITKINGKSIHSTAQLQAEISQVSPGENISVEFVRGNNTKRKNVILE